MNAIKETNFIFSENQSKYKGKVRDVYSINEILIMVATDRISAFDYVLPKAIPFKGQVLNQLALHFLNSTSDIVSNWVISSPDPNVTIGKKCTPYPVEMVVRGYLTGHAWREYKSGKRVLCGVSMPDGMLENQKFTTPIITPTTKANEGHDEDISKEKIINSNLINKFEYEQLEKFSLLLFERGTQIAEKQGLILVDTKYEFGKYNDEIILIDEIHTPDSSRYFYSKGYKERLEKGEQQKQLSKEFVRQWLIEHGFQGKEGQIMPDMPDDFVNQISERYIELFEVITGNVFERTNYSNRLKEMENNIANFLYS